MADSEYRKRQDGDGTVFEVTPATAPKNIYLITAAIMFGLFWGFVALAVDAPNAATAVLVIVAGFLFLAFRDGRPRAHKQRSAFRVSSSAIEKDGSTYPKDDIHRLIVKNGISGRLFDPTVVVASGNAYSALGRQHGINVSRVANALELEAGGKSFLLAGGMSETTAYGLMTDVAKAIGL